MLVEDFNYYLPGNLIATSPIFPRDEARMLTYDENGYLQYRVKNLPNLLQKNDLIILNDTKVINAKLKANINGKIVEFDLYKISENGHSSGFTKNSKKLEIGQEVNFADDFKAKIIGKDSGKIDLFFFPSSKNIFDQLNFHGITPLPPYIYKKVGQRLEDKENYQTIYARNSGSVASPTAGLHFTDELLAKLEKNNIKIAYVTLHVGAGTFLPVKTKNISDHMIHSEYGEISNENVEIINETKKIGGRILAVGTTTTRIVEFIQKKYGKLQEFAGEVDIFIKPGFKFEIIDMLMTNFHIPKSTLLMLIAAFIGYEETFKLYKYAISENFRFYSYGDSSLLYKKTGKC